MKVETGQTKAYEEVIELFANSTSPEGIISFKPTSESQERVEMLLEKSRTASLTAEEEAELDDFGLIEHPMRMVKVRARQKVKL